MHDSTKPATGGPVAVRCRLYCRVETRTESAVYSERLEKETMKIESRS